MKSGLVSAATAAFVATVAGIGVTLPVVLAAAAAVGATPAQTSSWVSGLALATAASALILSLRYRMPIITAWSTPGAALLHQARTLARRAERSAWALYEDDPDGTNREALLYLNRLSDLLFILARVANPDGDVKWVPGGQR